MSHAHLAQDILNAISAQDWDAFLAITTPDLKQQVLPRSLSRPEVDRDTWLARLKVNRAMIPDWKVEIRGDVISNETGVSFFVCISLSTTKLLLNILYPYRLLQLEPAPQTSHIPMITWSLCAYLKTFLGKSRSVVLMRCSIVPRLPNSW